MNKLYKGFLILAVSAVIAFPSMLSGKMIGKVETSGLMFKDKIEIYSFSDPTINGVVCHITMPKRSMSFEDQTNSSISCRQSSSSVTGKFNVDARNLFKGNKGLFFKSMTVDRFYDKENNSLVYISYTKKLSGDNASHSISTVPLYAN